jgi:serine/threonine protein kinase
VLLTKYYSLASKHRKYEIQKRVMAGSLSLFDDTADENIELPYVSFEDIAAATDNFSDSKKIGRGGFGKVYKVTKSFMSRVSVAHILSLRIFSRKQLLSSLNNSG